MKTKMPKKKKKMTARGPMNAAKRGAGKISKKGGAMKKGGGMKAGGMKGGAKMPKVTSKAKKPKK